ncbi:MAG: hypothetical protein KA792_02190 [Bacteroidales bacterium]|nr:hypothetical protein [Bacteroidales bacterium]
MEINNRNHFLLFNRKEINKSQIIDFIKQIEKYFFGFLVKDTDAIKKPIQPNLFFYKNSIYYNVKKIVNNKLINSFGNLINEITIMLYDDFFNKKQLIKYNEAYKQFIFPKFVKNSNNYDKALLIDFINQIKATKKIKLNLVIDISKIEKDFIIMFNKYSNFGIEYHIVVHNKLNFDIALEKLLLIINYNKDVLFNFLVVPPINSKKLFKLNTRLNFNNNFKFSFIVQNEKEINEVHTYICNNKLFKFDIIPYYNKKNIHFLKKYVYIRKKDILKHIQTFEELYFKEFYNISNFGKIIVDYNGDIYSNINKQKLGNIRINSFNQIVEKEIFEKRIWEINRNKVNPCSNCIYKILCPPISNYSFVLKKYNLCLL